MLSSKAKGAACLVASAFGFALMAFFVRLCDDFGAPISSFQKSFFRNIVALAIALSVILRNWRDASRELSAEAKPSSRSECTPGTVCSSESLCVPGVPSRPARQHFHSPPPPLLSTSLLLLFRATLGTIGIFANFYALSHIPIAEGQTLNKTAPFFTVVFAFFFLREKVSLRQILTLLIAFLGVVLIAKPGFAGEEAFPLAMGLLGGVCAGGAYTCVRALRTRGVDSALIILFFSAFSCLASLPFMFAKFDPMTLSQVLILFGAGASAALGQFGITLAYGYAAPRDIAVFDYTNILFTAVLGFVFFAQIPDLWSILGFIAILIAAFRLHA